jgi:hypothetical protein
MISRDDLATLDGVLVVSTSRGRLEILSPTVRAQGESRLVLFMQDPSSRSPSSRLEKV